MKNVVYFVTEYQYIEIIDRHTTKTQHIMQIVKNQMFSALTEARLYISQVWKQYQSHNYSYPSPDALILYEDRNKTKVAKLFQVESEDNMKYPNKIYIHRIFSKAAFLKDYEFDKNEYTWPDKCEGQRVYFYEGKDPNRLSMMGKDGKEYLCLYAWTEVEI